MFEQPEELVYNKTLNSEFNKKIIAGWDELQPKEESFSDIYSSEEIKEDIKKVEDFKHSEDFKKEKSEAGIALEYIFMDGVEGYEWLGKEAYVRPTSEYDDYINNIDCVIAFYDEKKDEYFYLGIDATTAQDRSWTDKKITQIKAKLQNGKLSQVKYFESEDTGEKGTIYVPRILVGTLPNRSLELMKKMTPRSKEIAKEKIQIEFLDQIKRQLTFSLHYLIQRLFGRYERIPKTSLKLINFYNTYEAKLKHAGKMFETISAYAKNLERILKVEKEKKQAFPEEIPIEHQREMPYAAIIAAAA